MGQVSIGGIIIVHPSIPQEGHPASGLDIYNIGSEKTRVVWANGRCIVDIIGGYVSAAINETMFVLLIITGTGLIIR